MIRKACTAAVVCVLLVSGRAHADAIDKGTFALGAERLTGVFHTSEKVGNGDSTGTTDIALFGNNSYSTVTGAWELPRLGFDFFVTNGLSIGGSFVVLAVSPANSSKTDIIVAPRVGYGFMFTRVVGIWPRAGFSYWHESASADVGNASASAHSFAFDVDVPLLIAPVRSFAITIGPLLDVSFAGQASGNLGVLGVNAGGSVDTSFVQFGLSAGVVGLL